MIGQVLPEWLQQWIEAARANLVHERVRSLVAVPSSSTSRLLRPTAAALLVRETLPYRFDGPDSAPPVVSYAAALARGFGACGEGSAVVAAAAHLAGVRATLCYERAAAVERYAHVVVVVDGTRVDPWPHVALAVSRCTDTHDVEELLRWRPPVAPRL